MTMYVCVCGVDTRRYQFLSSERIKSLEMNASWMLRNVLPAAVCDRLQNNSDLFVVEFPSISVLFVSIYEFSSLVSRTPAQDLFTLINDLLVEFDRRTAKV